MGMADTILIGKTGDVKDLASSALANNVLSVGIVFLVGISYAITPKTAEFKAQQDAQQCRDLLLTSFLNNSIWVGLVCLLFGVSLPFWTILGQDEEVTLRTMPFFMVLLAGLPGLMLFQTFRQYIDGLGNTKPGMVFSLIANGVNLMLNYALIFGHWGFPWMGLMGAGIANFIARWFMGLAILLYFYSSPHFQNWRPAWGRFFTLPWLYWLRKLNRTAIPISFQSIFEVAAFTFTAVLVGSMGSHELAAHQIVITLASFTYMMASGIASAASIRVGHFTGLHQLELLRDSGRKSMFLVVGLMSVSCLLFLFFRSEIPALFIANREVTEAASGIMLVAGLFQFSDGLQVVGLGCLRGMSDVRIPTLLTLVAYWVIAIPLAYFLGIYLGFGLQGTWWALLIGLSISAAFMLFRFFSNTKRINQKGYTA